MGTAKPAMRYRVFVPIFLRVWKFFNFAEISQRKMIAGMSKAAGSLKRVEIEKRRPEMNMIFGVNFLVKSSRNASIVEPIRKSSAFTILPSRSGIVVRMANINVEILCRFVFLGKRVFDNFQKIIMVTKCHVVKMTLNQNRLPAKLAVM
jgi:hypothetical protein